MSRTDNTATRLVFYSSEGYAAQEGICAILKSVLSSLAIEVDRRLAEHHLTQAQWAPLFSVAQGRCRTGAELARVLHSDPGAMTRAIDRLEAKGLLARRRSREDRRLVELEVTAAGQEVANFVPAVLSEVLNLHLAGFTTAEWRTLLNMLGRMRANGDDMLAPGCSQQRVQNTSN